MKLGNQGVGRQNNQCFQIRRICAKMAHLDPLVAHLLVTSRVARKVKKYGAFRVFQEKLLRKCKKMQFSKGKKSFFFFFAEFFVNSFVNLRLYSGLRNYPQVPFNKRLKGYRTVPSASPFYLHALYSGVGGWLLVVFGWLRIFLLVCRCAV